MAIAILLILFGAFSRLLPHPPNAVALGALALYSGARLPRGWAFAVPLAAMALSDFFLDFGTGRSILSATRVTIYATFAAIVLLGRLDVARARPALLVGLSLSASTLFFVTSNFAVWATGKMYLPTLSGLALCYLAAGPFFWNTLAADLAGTTLFFGLDSLSRRGHVWFPARTRTVGLLVLLGLVPAQARAQLPAAVSEKVVVTATAAPEEETEIGATTTVITRERIEREGFTTVLEVLRSVPGVDVVRSGSDGSVTSLFLRGSNSTHTLVLVDGVRVNSPFFSGYDFSALTTENVERIEIVRGPFSALYGSDALGGVIQIFTRPAAEKFAGRIALEAGNQGQRNGSAFVSVGTARFGAAASYRDARVEGGRRNSDWRERNGSLRLEGRFTESVRLALEGAILNGELGVPGPVGRETPENRSTFREERLALPVSFRPAANHEASLLVAHVASKPTFDSPGFSSETDARTFQARASDTWTLGKNRLTAFASWERWRVDNESNFGVNLDDDRSTLWGAGLQDTLQLPGRWTLAAGARYDRHSEFGSAWSPRATLSWLTRDTTWKVRASSGTAFRAPSIGELYFPFSGNVDLDPERSTSYELGVERYLAGGRAELSLFWNEFRDLIVFDNLRFQNFNVGRARTRGAELAFRQNFSERVGLDAGYTYLDAENRVTGGRLLRRPRHRAYLGANVRPAGKLLVSPRVTFVGRRADVDALSRAPVESPSYLRYDLFARYELSHVAPYARLENLTDRNYEEADGFPAPGRRFAAGLEVKF